MHDDLFARPSKLKVFVSSQMYRRVLAAERQAAVEAIEGTGMATAWHWEQDANAGPYSAEAVCLGHARTSDGLVLIIGRRLTPITRAEYEAAHRAGAPCYIFLKQRSRQDQDARAFVTAQRAAAITQSFGNASELKTQVAAALLGYAVHAVRRDIDRQRRRTRSRGA